MLVQELEDFVFPIWITMCRKVSLNHISTLLALQEIISEIQYKKIYRENDEESIEYVCVKITTCSYNFLWRMSTFAWSVLHDEIIKPSKGYQPALKWQKEGF